MKKIIIFISVVLIGGLIFWSIPLIKEKTYENEVDSLAFSYRIYKSSVCPNKTILKTIRDDYLTTIKPSDINKILWVNNYFDSRFIEACLQLNPHRGEY